MDKREAQAQIAKVLEEFEKSNGVVVTSVDILSYTIGTFGTPDSFESTVRELNINFTAKPGEGWR